jgi:hypothetical protein
MSPTARAVSEVSYPCRLLGHKWQIYLPEGAPRYALHLRCERCSMRRHDVCDAKGGLQSRRYLDVPDGYYMAKGEERPVVEELRVWAMRRQNRLMAGSVPVKG